MNADRWRAIVLVVLLIGSPLAGVAGFANPAAAQEGLTGVPDSNIREDLPAGSSVSLSASELRGSVMAGQHADSLEVIVTTPRRASEYVNNSRIGNGNVALVFKDDSNHAGRMVAVPKAPIEAAVGHVPETVYGTHESGETWTADVREANGLLRFKIPKFSSNTVTFSGTVRQQGTFTDGSSVSYGLENATSTTDPNVTFTGVDSTERDTVSASAVGNGGTVALDVAGASAATNAEVTFTGTGFGERWDNYSAVGVSPSNTSAISVEGAQQPTNGSGGDPTLSVTGHAASVSYNPFTAQGDGVGDSSETFVGDNGDTGTYTGHYWSEAHIYPTESGEITVIAPNIKQAQNGDSGHTVDIYIEPGTRDGTQTDGTLVKTGWDPSWTTGRQSITLDTPYAVQAGNTYTVTFSTQGSQTSSSQLTLGLDGSASATEFTQHIEGGSWTATFASYSNLDMTIKQTPSGVSVADGAGHSSTLGDFSDGQTKTTTLNLNSSSTNLDFSGSGGTLDYTLTMQENDRTDSPAIDVDGDGLTDASHTGILDPGVTATYALSDLALSDDTGTVSLTSPSAPVDVSVSYTEHTGTDSPALEVNGHWLNYSGTLAAGESVSRTGNSSWLVKGENTLNTSLADGGLSTDAPPMQVDMNYTHDADTQIDATYVDDGWAETYNVSKTFSSTQENPELYIPFSQTVYALQTMQYQVDGGSWQQFQESDYTLDGSELTIQLTDGDGDGDVDAGTEIRVKATGLKIKPVNGEITVTEPTQPGDNTLDTEFRIDSQSGGFYLEVGPSYYGDRVHYVYQESWSDPADSVIIDSSGDQELYLPNAQAGDTARVTIVPVQAIPQSGDVELEVEDPDGVTLKVLPGSTASGDDVAFRLYNVIEGDKYGAYSVSRGRYVAKADAGASYVELLEDDSEETLRLEPVSDSSGSSGTEQVVATWPQPTVGVQLQEVGVVVAWAALVLGLVAATGRSKVRGRSRWILVGSVGTGAGLLSIEVLRPGLISSAIATGLEDVVALGGLAAIGIVGYSVVSWWQSRKKEAATPETQVSFNLRGK